MWGRFRWLREMPCQLRGWRLPQGLNLVKRLFTVGCKGDGDPQPEILKRYRNQFSGIGTLPSEYEVKIDASVTPVVHPRRGIPYMLRNKVKAELDRMDRMGIITKVAQPKKRGRSDCSSEEGKWWWSHLSWSGKERTLSAQNSGRGSGNSCRS